MNFKYLNVIWKQSVSQFFIYRLTSFFVCFFGMLFTAIEVVTVKVLYNFTETINGWDYYSFLTLIATYTLISYIYQFFFTVSHEDLVEKIVEGELDYDLIRPVDSQLINSVKSLDIPSIFNIIIAVILLMISVPKVIIIESSYSLIPLFILFVFVGVYFYYLLNQFFINFSFWIEKPYQITSIPEYLLDLASRPRNVYPSVLNILFVWIFPILLSTNIPVELLKGEIRFATIIYYLLFILLFTIVVRIQWKWGLKKYHSTN